MKINMIQITGYVVLTGSGMLEPTTERPSPEQQKRLEYELINVRRHTHEHNPGDGEHYLPLPVLAAFYPYYNSWSLEPTTCEGAVLCHAEDLCHALGLGFDAICKEGTPKGCTHYRPSQEVRATCGRTATKNDVQAVLADLEAINYHSLRNALKDAIDALDF